MPAFEYIKTIFGSVIFSWVGKAVTLYPLLICITTLYSCRPRKMALWVTSAIVTFFQTVPIYFAYYFVMPQSLNLLWHSLFVASIPFLVFVIYPLLKYYVRIPAGRCAAISKKAIGYLNIPICMFLAVQELLLNRMEWKWENRVTIDNYASVVCIAITILLFITVYAYIQRKNIRVKATYNDTGRKHALFFAFLEVAIIYVALVLFRMLFATSPETTPYNVQSSALHYVSYALLIIMWFGYLILEVYRDILHVSRYEAQNLMAHIAVLEETSEQYRAIRHDINNMLQVYGSYIALGDLEKLKAYHQSVFKTNADVNLRMDLSGKLDQYLPLYALLMAKDEEASRLGINFDVTSARIEAGLQIQDLELCRIMGILIDNALEASEQSSRKTAAVSIENRDNAAMFIVSNSLDTFINIKQIFIKNYSTKGPDRGLGLYEVDKMVKRNEHLSLSVKQYDSMISFYLGVEYPQVEEDSHAQRYAI